MGTYLIPANSKKSLLIFSRFNTVDLWVFIGGLIVSFVLFLIIMLQSYIKFSIITRF